MAAAALLFTPVAASGATLTVTSDADSGPGTLRQLISDAASGDTINFALPGNTSAIELTSGELLINKSLTISSGGTILDPLALYRSFNGPQIPSFRIFHITGNCEVNISGFSIRNGSSPGVTSGGGILSEGGSTVTVTDCTLTGNAATGSGSSGSAICNSSGSTMTVAGNFIYDNPANSNGDNIFNAGTMTVTHTTLPGNSSQNTGGPMYNVGSTSITNSTVSGSISNTGTLTIGSSVGFGVLSFSSSATVSISASTCRRLSNGSPNSTMTITNSTISGNHAADGGGIFNAGMATLTHCTISGNQADSNGGGMFNSGTATITSSTISNNSAGSASGGGGICNASGGTVNVRNSIIASNTGPSGSPDFSGTVTSQGFNLIGNNAGAFITPTQFTDQIGTPASPKDPQLGPLRDNGGPTQTQALPSSGSPANDKGHSSGSNTDQRGFTRPIDNPGISNATDGDGSDIGAFEVQASTPTPTSTPTPGSLGNISTRLQVGTSDNVMIAGFIVKGNAPKKVIIRAGGPSLTKFGVPDVLANPQLELHDTNSTIGQNDDWQTTQMGGVITSNQVAEIQNSGLAPSDPAESAIIATLPPGNYTAIVRGVNSTTGVGLVEVYDLSSNSGSLLANISTRGFVQTGDNVMFGGFIVVTQPTKVIIRAIGPSLAQFGVTNAMADPQLELRGDNGTSAVNDDWQTTQFGGIITSDQTAAIQSSGLAPSNSAESAIIATLAPGNYTAIVRGKSGGTGVASVEVYNLQ